MTIAANELQFHLSSGQAAVGSFTIGLLLTFLGVRINTRLIRANVKWWFHDIESKGGVHVHHMVIGVILMVVTGISLIAFQPHAIWLDVISFLFGAGVALTLDEFALILRLQDVYWSKEGRLSVDAVIIAVCAGTLLSLGVRPLSNTHVAGLAGTTATIVFAVVILLDLAIAVLCLFKGKLWTGFFGLFVPFVGIIGAIRVARPFSPWAHKRYQLKPKKLAKAQRREDRTNASWRAWRTAFFDLIAGKPHVPAPEAFGLEAAAGAAAGEASAAVTGDEDGDEKVSGVAGEDRTDDAP
jgi:lysyl-tRNA synthetase, class II